MTSELVCNYAHLVDGEGTQPCWGPVTLVEITDMSSGDRVMVPACSGHRKLVELGFYLSEGAQVESEGPDTDPDMVVSPPSEDVL